MAQTSLESSFSFMAAPRGMPSYQNLTKAQAIQSLGSWYNNPVLMNVTCVGEAGATHVVGPENPELCIERVEVLLSSSMAGNLTVEFDADQLNSYRKLKAIDRDQYVYPLPLSWFAAPDALYEYVELHAIGADGNSQNQPLLDHQVVNYYNASASSLREQYGIDPALQGSNQTRQASMMAFEFFVGADGAVNTTAVNEYLELQGIVPNVPVQLPDWAAPNDVSICSSAEHPCSEPMLDVEVQHEFAPQAITYFVPTESVSREALAVALDEAGYGDADVEQQIELYYKSINAAWRDIPLVDQPDKWALEVENGVFRRSFGDFLHNLTREKVQAISFSWGGDYSLNGTIPYSFLEEGLKNLTMSGITLFAASGDSGASGSNDGCKTSDDPMFSNDPQMVWPMVSPWVTAVGGTQFLAISVDGPPEEVVCSTMTGGGITSGGGFAGPHFPEDLYSMPAWQERAVKRYLTQNNASTGFPTADVTPGFNPSGRAYPDIAMYAARFPILKYDGGLQLVAGTSLAAPIAAAIFTLANQELLESGYEAIGYANPMLYWMAESCPEAFNDVKMGNNQAAKGEPVECLYGFPAAQGWDAATGLGSIRFGSFVSCAKRYQDEVRSKGLELLPDGSHRPAPVKASAPRYGAGLLLALVGLARQTTYL